MAVAFVGESNRSLRSIAEILKSRRYYAKQRFVLSSAPFLKIHFFLRDSEKKDGHKRNTLRSDLKEKDVTE